MTPLIIQPQEGKKGRSFQATCVATVTANAMFPEANGKTIRPVWAMFAGSEQELRPFIANLMLGRKADPHTRFQNKRDQNRYEFMRSVGYKVSWQRETEGSLVTIYHPDLFRLDPGMVDPKGLNFILLAPTYWLQAQTMDLRPAVDHILALGGTEEMVGLATVSYLFAAYIDRRTRCPLVADGRFYLQLLCACLTEGLAAFSTSPDTSFYRYEDQWGYSRKHYEFTSKDLDQVGIQMAISFMATHEQFELLLAEQVKIYFNATNQEFAPLSELIDLSLFKESA